MSVFSEQAARFFSGAHWGGIVAGLLGQQTVPGVEVSVIFIRVSASFMCSAVEGLDATIKFLRSFLYNLGQWRVDGMRCKVTGHP